jgi:hypothetical protein
MVRCRDELQVIASCHTALKDYRGGDSTVAISWATNVLNEKSGWILTAVNPDRGVVSSCGATISDDPASFRNWGFHDVQQAAHDVIDANKEGEIDNSLLSEGPNGGLVGIVCHSMFRGKFTREVQSDAGRLA